MRWDHAPQQEALIHRFWRHSGIFSDIAGFAGVFRFLNIVRRIGRVATTGRGSYGLEPMNENNGNNGTNDAYGLETCPI